MENTKVTGIRHEEKERLKLYLVTGTKGKILNNFCSLVVAKSKKEARLNVPNYVTQAKALRVKKTKFACTLYSNCLY